MAPGKAFFLENLKKITKNVGFLDHLHRPMDGFQRSLCLLQTFFIEMCYPYALCTVAVEAIISHHLEPFKKTTMHSAQTIFECPESSNMNITTTTLSFCIDHT